MLESKVLFRKAAAAVLSAVLVLQLTGCAAFQSLVSKGLSQLENKNGSAASLSQPETSAAGSSTPSSGSSNKAAGNMPQKVPETEESQSVKRESVVRSAAPSSGYQVVSQDEGYRSLQTGAQKSLYEAIERSVYQVAVSKTSRGDIPVGRIVTSDSLTEAQIHLTIMAFLDDNPQIFWIADAYSSARLGNQTVIQLYSELTRGECNAAVSKFNRKIQSIIRSVPAGLSEFDREEYLFHYITRNCAYQDTGGWEPYTAYGALMEGKAVCEGYSRAMLLLSGDTGLSGMLIRGTGDGAAHMWNGIQISGNWYHIDLTWCDSSHLVYNYFNVDDQVIRLTHTIAPAASSLKDAQICSAESIYNLTIPKCSSMRENYFRRKGIPITTLNASGNNAVISAVADQMKSRRTTIAFRIATAHYDETVRQLTSVSPYQMSFYLKKAAAEAGVTIDLKGLSYVTDQADSGLDIFVNYL